MHAVATETTHRSIANGYIQVIATSSRDAATAPATAGNGKAVQVKDHLVCQNLNHIDIPIGDKQITHEPVLPRLRQL